MNGSNYLILETAQMKDRGSDVFVWSRQLLRGQTTDTDSGSALPPISLYDSYN